MQPGTKLLLGTKRLKYTLGNPDLLQNGTKEEHGTIFFSFFSFFFALFISKIVNETTHMQQKTSEQLLQSIRKTIYFWYKWWVISFREYLGLSNVC